MRPDDAAGSAGRPGATAEVSGGTSPPASETPPFGQAVGFLLSQLGFETARRFGDLMSEVELEPRQFALLRSIAAQEGRSQNEVADTLRIPPSTMVSVIDYLEDRGLVERRLHPTDRRSRVLYMTSEGKKLLDRATSLAMGLETTICEGITSSEREQLLTMLMHVADNLGLERGLHPDTSTGHGRAHWTDEADGPKGKKNTPRP